MKKVGNVKVCKVNAFYLKKKNLKKTKMSKYLKNYIM